MLFPFLLILSLSSFPYPKLLSGRYHIFRVISMNSEKLEHNESLHKLEIMDQNERVQQREEQRVWIENNGENGYTKRKSQSIGRENILCRRTWEVTICWMAPASFWKPSQCCLADVCFCGAQYNSQRFSKEPQLNFVFSYCLLEVPTLIFVFFVMWYDFFTYRLYPYIRPVVSLS